MKAGPKETITKTMAASPRRRTRIEEPHQCYAAELFLLKIQFYTQINDKIVTHCDRW